MALSTESLMCSACFQGHMKIHLRILTKTQRVCPACEGTKKNVLFGGFLNVLISLGGPGKGSA